MLDASSFFFCYYYGFDVLIYLHAAYNKFNVLINFTVFHIFSQKSWHKHRYLVLQSVKEFHKYLVAEQDGQQTVKLDTAVRLCQMSSSARLSYITQNVIFTTITKHYFHNNYYYWQYSKMPVLHSWTLILMLNWSKWNLTEVCDYVTIISSLHSITYPFSVRLKHGSPHNNWLMTWMC